MPRDPKLSDNPTPVTGVYAPESLLSADEHHVGWDRALADALENINRERGDYQVHVEFSAVVNVENPGNIIEYQVTVI